MFQMFQNTWRLAVKKGDLVRLLPRERFPPRFATIVIVARGGHRAYPVFLLHFLDGREPKEWWVLEEEIERVDVVTLLSTLKGTP